MVGTGLTGCSGRVRSLLGSVLVKPDSSVALCGTSVGSRWSRDVPCPQAWHYLDTPVPLCWGGAGGLQHSQILLMSDLAPGTQTPQSP